MNSTQYDSNARSEIFALYQARLRAEEIEFAAREEHDQALQRLVDSSYTKLNSDYELERSKIDRNAKISYSVSKNKQRITILNAQRDIITKAMVVVRERLAKMVKTDEYKKLFSALLKQGLLVLMEKDVKISVLPRDEQLAEECIKEVVEEVKDKLECKVEVNTENPLNEKSIGGMEFSNADDTIRLDNTLEARLQLSSEGALPEIQRLLK